MTIDLTTALEAADEWRALAKLIPTLNAYLQPGRKGSNTGSRKIPESRIPLDIEASDLLHDINETATWYTSCLLMETTDVKRAPDTLEGMLNLIAERHGHWTGVDDYRMARVKGPDGKDARDDDGTYKRQARSVALDFTDDAHTLMTRALRLIVQPIPPRFMGRCPERCGGDVWLDQLAGAHWGKPERRILPDHDSGAYTLPTVTCDTCGASVTIAKVREQLAREFALCVMDRDELLNAARILGRHVKPGTLRQWIARGRLVAVIREPERFRFADFADLARLEVAA